MPRVVDVILSSIRRHTIKKKKTGVNFLFTIKKSSITSNFAGKNEGNATKFMTFLN